jgi:hypothetical protein
MRDLSFSFQLLDMTVMTAGITGAAYHGLEAPRGSYSMLVVLLSTLRYQKAHTGETATAKACPKSELRNGGLR